MNQEKLYSVVRSLDRQTQNIIFSEYIKDFIQGINKNLIEEGLIRNKIVEFFIPNDKNNKIVDNYIETISIVSPEVCNVIEFSKDMGVLEKIEVFESNQELIKEKAYEYARRISQARNTVRVMVEQLMQEVKENFLIPEPDLLYFKQHSYHNYMDGQEMTYIYYKDTELMHYKFNLCLPEEDYNKVKEEMYNFSKTRIGRSMEKFVVPEMEEKLIAVFQQLRPLENIKIEFVENLPKPYIQKDFGTYSVDKSVVRDKTVLSKIVNEVKDETKVSRIRHFVAENFDGIDFEVTKDSKYPYDIQKGTINSFFNVDNEKMRSKFIADVVKAYELE